MLGATHTCYGTGAPVILHYPNATFAYWQHKYKMLTVAPAFGEGTQISLKGLPRLARTLEKAMSKTADQQTKVRRGTDGDDEPGEGGDEKAADIAGLAADKAGKGKVNGMHELAAAVVQRAASTGDEKDFKFVESLYRMQFCVTDMLPPLASHGLLVEINFVRDLIRRELQAMDEAECR